MSERSQFPHVDLPAALHDLLAQVPHGQVTTFGTLARALGDVKAARWVAVELQGLRDADAPVPWHRVLRQTGEFMAGSALDQHRQQAALSAEGVHIDPAIGHYRLLQFWDGFTSSRPLQQLAEWQSQLAVQADHTRHVECPAIVGGIDVSYASPQHAVAAFVAVDVGTREVCFETTVSSEVHFPYIAGYLLNRELPPLLRLLEQVRQQMPLPEVILVDGAGALHPRGAGIGVAVGVVADCCTIGVAKHRLCGSLKPEPQLPFGQALWWQERCVGAADDGGYARSPCDISPGHRVDLCSALTIVRRVWRDRRGPLPIVLADRLSRRVARTQRPPRTA